MIFDTFSEGFLALGTTNKHQGFNNHSKPNQHFSQHEQHEFTCTSQEPLLLSQMWQTARNRCEKCRPVHRLRGYAVQPRLGCIIHQFVLFYWTWITIWKFRYKCRQTDVCCLQTAVNGVSREGFISWWPDWHSSFGTRDARSLRRVRR